MTTPKLWTPPEEPAKEEPLFLRLVEGSNGPCLVICNRDGAQVGGGRVLTILEEGAVWLHSDVDRDAARRAGITLDGASRILTA